MVFRISTALVVLTLSPLAAWAQSASPQEPSTVKLSGPRVGVTFLTDHMIEKLRQEDGIHVGSMISQFGWQFEKRLYASPDAFTALTELVVLVGGLDQNTALPSATWLLGFRTVEGLEIGVGPTFTPRGTSVAFAGGVTLKTGRLNIPVNIALVPSSSGVRVSVLTGFNARKR